MYNPSVAKTGLVGLLLLAAAGRGLCEDAARRAAEAKVPPGKVEWHADFATACRAARDSGKPVLLFQMMGRLDHQFC
jgi:hypothetical protein